mgnify:CR=1 FL=1
MFSWCKGSVFLFVSGVFMVKKQCFFVGFGGLRVSNAGFAGFEKAVKFYCKGCYVGCGGCYYGSVYAVSGYESEACEEGDG